MAASIEFCYFYSPLIKKNKRNPQPECPKFHSKHCHGDKVLSKKRGYGGVGAGWPWPAESVNGVP